MEDSNTEEKIPELSPLEEFKMDVFLIMRRHKGLSAENYVSCFKDMISYFCNGPDEKTLQACIMAMMTPEKDL